MTDPLTHHKRFSPAELEAQYFLRARRPDLDDTVIADWMARSETARAALECTLDVRHGEGAKQKLDVFSCADADAPVLVYFHGGYWQGGDKSVYSFLAEPFVAAGVNVVVVGYDLCPAVTVSEITGEARDAMAYLWRNAGALGINPDRIHVMGHSAGGHTALMMMATDWTALSPDLPKDLIKSAIPISPLSYLEPVRLTSVLNAALNLTPEEAEAESPMTRHPPLTNAPQLIVVGGAETTEFHRQARMYADTYATPQRSIEVYTVPGVDHFDEINVLADPQSALFGKVCALVTEE